MLPYLFMVAAFAVGIFAEWVNASSPTDQIVLAIITFGGLLLTTTLPYVGFSSSKENVQRNIYSTAGYILIGLTTGIVITQFFRGTTSLGILMVYLTLDAIPLAIYASAAQSNLERLQMLLAGTPASDVTRRAALLGAKAEPEEALKILQ